MGSLRVFFLPVHLPGGSLSPAEARSDRGARGSRLAGRSERTVWGSPAWCWRAGPRAAMAGKMVVAAHYEWHADRLRRAAPKAARALSGTAAVGVGSRLRLWVALRGPHRPRAHPAPRWRSTEPPKRPPADPRAGAVKNRCANRATRPSRRSGWIATRGGWSYNDHSLAVLQKVPEGSLVVATLREIVHEREEVEELMPQRPLPFG